MSGPTLAALVTATALIAASSAPVLADSASPGVTQSSTNQVVGNGSATGSTATSTIGGGAAMGATGNLGLNAASGNANQQANALLLEATGTPASGGGLASGTSTSQTITNSGQQTAGPNASGPVTTNDTASIQPNSGSLPGYPNSGNAGFNTAAGDLNAQSNVLVLGVKPAAGTSTDGTTQTITGGSNQTDMRGTSYGASLSGSPARLENGNVGFNVGAGEKNLQSNDLTLARASGGAASAAGATQTTQQTIGADVVHQSNGASYTSSIPDFAAFASGNAGANVAAGASNVQSNATLIVTNPATITPVAQAATIGTSGTYDNVGSGSTTASMSSSINGSTGEFATGNVGANVASGALSVQSNQLLLANHGGSTAAGGNIGQSERANAGGTVSLAAGSNGIGSTIGGFSATFSGGNVGLNASAGVANAQVNQALLNRIEASAGQGVQHALSGSGSLQTGASGVSSDIGGYAGSFASGNVGANAAAGTQNLQGNAFMALGPPSGTASGNSLSQTLGSELSSAASTSGTSAISSAINGFAGAFLQGNGGYNSAAGVQNVQDNVSMMVAGRAASVSQSFTPHETGSVTLGGSGAGSPTMSAKVGDFVGYDTSGNLGANNAAGAQNVQANGLVIVRGAGTGGSISQQSPASGSNTAALDGASYVAAGTMNATVTDFAGYQLTGRGGFNSAAGAQNVQSNVTGVYSGLLSAPVSTQNLNQTTNISSAGATLVLGPDNANTTAFAGASASGIVGINVAAGVQNQQSNAASVFLNTSSGGPTTGIATTQTVNGNGPNGAHVQLTDPAGNSVSSRITDFSGDSAAGEIGINVAAGAGNQQSGVLSVVNGTAASAGTASSTIGQQSNSLTLSSTGPGAWNSNVDGFAFHHASGSLSANSAAGGYSQQTNALTLTTANLGDIAPKTTQQISGATIETTNAATSTIGAFAFQSASGNIGANSASGNGIQQVNNVIVRP